VIVVFLIFSTIFRRRKAQELEADPRVSGSTLGGPDSKSSIRTTSVDGFDLRESMDMEDIPSINSPDKDGIEDIKDESPHVVVVDDKAQVLNK
jgi:hypothetical protein